MGLQHQTCSTDVNSGSVLKCYECGLKKKKKKKRKKEKKKEKKEEKKKEEALYLQRVFFVLFCL